MSAVRVVVIHPRDIVQPTSGGIQTFLGDFIRHSPADFDIRVAGVTSDPAVRPVGQWARAEVGDRAVRFLPLAPSDGSLGRPRTLVQATHALMMLRRELVARQPILQLHRPYRSGLFRGHSGPRVRFIHVDLEHISSQSAWRRLAWLYRGFSDDLARFDRVFVANERGALALRATNPDMAKRIEFLPGWYDDNLFGPAPAHTRERDRTMLAQRLSLPIEAAFDRWILLVGRLDAVKDPTLAVDAFAELASGQGGVRLIVCGGGELEDAVRSQAAARNMASRTHIVGDQPRELVARLMRSGDVLLVSSQAEGGGPRVVLEALGSGLPVVSTVVGEVRRFIVPARNGWLAEHGSAHELAEGLRWALAQPREELIARAIDAAHSFTAKRVLERVYAAYRELADKIPPEIR